MFPLKELRALQALCGTPKEFGAKINVPPPTIRSWIRLGNIPRKYWDRLQAIHPGILTDKMLHTMEYHHQINSLRLRSRHDKY